MRYPCTSVAGGNAGVARLKDRGWDKWRAGERESARERAREREQEGKRDRERERERERERKRGGERAHLGDGVWDGLPARWGV